MKELATSTQRYFAGAAAAGTLVFGAVFTPRIAATARAEDETTRVVVGRDESRNQTGTPRIVKLDELDPDSLQEVQRLLAVRGYYDGPVDGKARLETERALRTFSIAQGIETTSESGTVLVSAIDTLGAGNEVALRWGSKTPRSELTAAECFRINYALARRGYRGDGALPDSIDASTVEALKKLQKDMGYPVQQGNFVARRWLYVLGVATPESCPEPTKGTTTVPAGMPRDQGDKKAPDQEADDKKAPDQKADDKPVPDKKAPENGGVGKVIPESAPPEARDPQRATDVPRQAGPRSDLIPGSGNVPKTDKLPPSTPPNTPRPDEKR